MFSRNISIVALPRPFSVQNFVHKDACAELARQRVVVAIERSGVLQAKTVQAQAGEQMIFNLLHEGHFLPIEDIRSVEISFIEDAYRTLATDPAKKENNNGVVRLLLPLNYEIILCERALTDASEVVEGHVAPMFEEGADVVAVSKVWQTRIIFERVRGD